jgi:sulfur relay (sulfurtransferase) DsrF/TusC family protein
MRIKKDILKQLKSIKIPEIKDIFACKRFTITNDLEVRITKLVNTIAGKESYNLEDGFSGSKQNNSITFYLGRYDIEVVFTSTGSVKDFSVDKTACDIGGLI